MTSFLTGLWARLWMVLAIVSALVVAIFKIREGGRDAERAAQARNDARVRHDASEADRMVERAGDGELDELRRKWTRHG